ncbi:DegQ family serine endoprotease [Cohaesibacter celericrescens]|uniref:Serine protease n=1 Tax=Cohaesibacter celericrescens TaxID=2067669 RepID=A0A2N5XVK0_9HYPH|nr:DegQ family serine endoprotease [Cohaesibacter celericrescens]PLW78532.1 serine protease [Cohaesibacter celericrescens]
MKRLFKRSAVVFVAVVMSLGTALAQDKVPSSKMEMQLSFSPLVQSAAPAVVNVYATRKVQARSRSPFFDDPFFQRFFGNGGIGQPRERVQRSLGSGVIVDPSGVIVTNHHVIDGATEVKIALSDRSEFEADVVLDDERTDLAILKVRDAKHPFPSLEFADSDDLLVGDLVLAIGNPFGVGQTVTSGIVSALARTQVGVTDYQFFIQTDAAINPGNSGGALVDMKGRLVGINSSIFTRSGGSNGIGFAIPANMVRVVAEAAISGNKVQRAWFGGNLQTVSADIAEGLGMDRPQGVLVTEIDPAGPAQAAGLQVGDLILKVNDNTVNSPDGFGYRFTTVGIGETVRLTILRQGSEKQISLKAVAAPEKPLRDEREIAGYSPFSGTKILNLSPAVAQELGLETSMTGVVISHVAQGSTAQRLGVKAGDIVRRINGEFIRNTKVMKILCDQKFRLWRLEIEREGKLIKTVISG